MKFTIFSFQERHYKKIAVACTVLITVISISVYFCSLKVQDTNSNLISFIVSIAYALALFVLGLYLSTQSARLENRFLAIKEQYLSLCNFQGLFSSECIAKENFNDLKSFVIFHQLFTARSDEEKVDKPFINGDFYTYKSRYLKCEKNFQSVHDELITKISKSVNTFIEENGIVKKVPYPHVNSIEDFFSNFHAWVEQHFEPNKPQMQLLSDFQVQFLREQRSLIGTLTKKAKYLIAKNKKIRKKISDNKNKIEAIYGQKLHREIERESLISNAMSNIDSLLQKISTQTENLYSNDEDMQLAVADIRQAISGLSVLIANQEDAL